MALTMSVLIKNRIQLIPLNARTALQFLQDDRLAALPGASWKRRQ
jgi:hypothetical protein